MKKRTLLIGIISLMIVGVLAAGCGDDYDKNVLLVRNGTMNMMPDDPIDKAFDKFFNKGGSWRSFTSTQNETIVEFEGKYTLLASTPSKALVQFKLTGGKNFDLQYVALDGEAMDYDERIIFTGMVLAAYTP